MHAVTNNNMDCQTLPTTVIGTLNTSSLFAENVTSSRFDDNDADDDGDECYDSFLALREIPIVIAFIVSILIVVNNAINLVVLVQMNSINSRVKALMASMSASDLLLGVVVCIPGLAAGILGDWPFSPAFCQITGIINGMSISVSMWSLTAISVERLLVVVKPFHLYHEPRLQHIRAAIGFIWIFNTIYYVIPILSSGDMIYYTYQAELFVCGFVWEPDWLLYLAGILYPIGPGLIIVFCSVTIIRSIRNSNLTIATVSLDFSVSSLSKNIPTQSFMVSSSTGTGQDNAVLTTNQVSLLTVPGPSRRHLLENRLVAQSPPTSSRGRVPLFVMKREAKVSKVMILTAAAFFSCSLPYLCTNVLEKLNPGSISDWQKFGVMWLLNCNSFINVFIYSMSYGEFRNIFRKGAMLVFSKVCHKCAC